jgi:hypothetical protein
MVVLAPQDDLLRVVAEELNLVMQFLGRPELVCFGVNQQMMEYLSGMIFHFVESTY